jgi:hypothetical protein
LCLRGTFWASQEEKLNLPSFIFYISHENEFINKWSIFEKERNTPHTFLITF